MQCLNMFFIGMGLDLFRIEDSAVLGSIFNYIVDRLLKLSLCPMVTPRYLTQFDQFIGWLSIYKRDTCSTSVTKHDGFGFEGIDFDAPTVEAFANQVQLMFEYAVADGSVFMAHLQHLAIGRRELQLLVEIHAAAVSIVHFLNDLLLCSNAPLQRYYICRQ